MTLRGRIGVLPVLPNGFMAPMIENVFRRHLSDERGSSAAFALLLRLELQRRRTLKRRKRRAPAARFMQKLDFIASKMFRRSSPRECGPATRVRPVSQ